MQSPNNPTRPTDRSYRGPRSVGGLVVYLLALSVFVAALVVPGLVVAAAAGAVTALAVQKLRRRSRRRSAGTGSRTTLPRFSKSLR